jgi:hypothetical protein
VRALKILTVVMGLMIVVGTTVLVVVIVRRVGGDAGMSAPISATLDEPEGTRIVGIAAASDRLAVQLQGGGADRIVLIDPRTARVVGRVQLAR